MNFSSAGSKRSLKHPLQGRSRTSGKLSRFLARHGLQLPEPYSVDISIGGPRETRGSDPSVRECLSPPVVAEPSFDVLLLLRDQLHGCTVRV